MPLPFYLQKQINIRLTATNIIKHLVHTKTHVTPLIWIGRNTDGLVTKYRLLFVPITLSIHNLWKSSLMYRQ